MKSVRRKIELLSFYDRTGIERHLAKMAREGWMIEKISNFFWTYRAIEPKELHFSVSYFEKASDFDPEPSGGQQTMMDLCAATGWKVACTWCQMQVFYSEETDPTPIDTDPALEVEAIHRGCRRNYLRAYWFLFALSVIPALLFISTCISDLIRLLADPFGRTTGSAFLILFLYTATELAVYYLWRRKARKAAKCGAFTKTPTTYPFQLTMLVILIADSLFFLVDLLFTGNRIALISVFAVLLLFAVVGTATNLVKEGLKRKKVSAGVNRMTTLVVCFVVSFVLWGVMMGTLIHLVSSADAAGDDFYREAPLDITDLVAGEEGRHTERTESDHSMFFERMEVEYLLRPYEKPSETDCEMEYELYAVRIDGMYTFTRRCLERKMLASVFFKGDIEEAGRTAGGYSVYRLVTDDKTGTHMYLLCGENMLARIEFSWTPSEEQIEKAAQKLFSAGV